MATSLASQLHAFVKPLVPENIRHYLAGRKRSEGKVFFKAHFLGDEIFVYEADKLSKEWYNKPWTRDNRKEFSEFQRLNISKYATIFDIGAHHGIVAILLKRTLVPNGKVIAIEIDKFNASVCEKNFQRNMELDNLVVVNRAISDSCKPVKYTGRSNSAVSKNPSLGFLLPKCQSTTIDELCNLYGLPELVYLDVEGAEILALKGASNSIGKIKHWFIEMHGDDECAKFGGANKDIIDKMAKSGYNLKFSASEDGDFDVIQPGFQWSGRGFLIASVADI